MTDPANVTALATSAVAALIPLLKKAAGKAAEKLGESTTVSLLAAFREKISQSRTKESPAAKDALEDLASAPTDAYKQLILTVKLVEALKADHHLAEEIKRLLDADHTATGINITTTATSGAKVVENIGNNNNISIR